MQIELGKVLKPQGIKGELKVLPLSKPELLQTASEVSVGGNLVRVMSCKIRDGYAYMFLENCRDRNRAEELRDAIIYLPTNTEVSLEENEYFFDDLIDCEVYDSDKKYLGRVVLVENYGATDIITIHKDLFNIACPFLKEVFLSVDTLNKRIVVDAQKFGEVTNYDED